MSPKFSTRQRKIAYYSRPPSAFARLLDKRSFSSRLGNASMTLLSLVY